eukprot:COSAG02_NODE_1612_length_11675_cov_29.558310_9_plen_126_part_00
MLAWSTGAGVRPIAKTNHVLIKGISLLGCRAGEAVRRGQADGGARQRKLRQWAADGRLRPYISHAMPLDQVQEAFRMMWRREVIGRICVAPAGVEEAKATAGPSPSPDAAAGVSSNSSSVARSRL